MSSPSELLPHVQDTLCILSNKLVFLNAYATLFVNLATFTYFNTLVILALVNYKYNTLVILPFQEEY